MPVLRQSQASYPFWGKAVQTINGLDPLGLQTTSEATYSLLLPGVTNLTNHIRYYGFYCWLLNGYFEQETQGNSVEQFRLVRRSELLIALLMQNQQPNVNQITGSRYAANWLDQPRTSFQLADGADYIKGVTKALYWQYKSGAFGQYYLGPMKALNLVTIATDATNDELYMVTKSDLQGSMSGQALANAFDASLSDDIRGLFYQCVKSGHVDRNALKMLAEGFTISTIDPLGPEGELYCRLLREPDYPAQAHPDACTFHRRDTISGLLDVANRNQGLYKSGTYLQQCYQQQMGSTTRPTTDTEKGWYTYCLNEYWQYACGSMLWGMLARLDKYAEPQYLPVFVDQLVTEVMNDLEQTLDTDGTLGDVLARLLPNWTEADCVADIDARIKADEGIPAVAAGFCLLFQLYANNANQLPAVGVFINQHRTQRDGNMFDGLTYLTETIDQPLGVFIRHFLYRYIINRHRLVAMRKMGNGFQATHKFLIDEQYIHFVANFLPRFTSPRMWALSNLLVDLQFLEKEGDKLRLSEYWEFFID